MEHRTCAVDGCENAPRSGSADWCPKHYHRWYRHGSVHRVDTGDVSVSHGRRYRYVTCAGHPLANPKTGRAYEHRVVLYDQIGPGPHACHWCGDEVDWLPKGDPGCLQADHLNGYGDDNRPENLVPSCNACNTARGSQARAEALRQLGWWSNHDTIAGLSAGGRRAPVTTADHLRRQLDVA